MPAAFAGAAGSPGRQSRVGRLDVGLGDGDDALRDATPTVVVALSMPMNMKAMPKRTNASTRLMATPEPMMMIRCHHGLL